MIIKEKLGNLAAYPNAGKAIDYLGIEWFETGKRILHKRTTSGKEVVLKLLNEAQHLQQDDVLYADEQCLVVVDLLPCEAMVLKPATMHEMASICYEVGNKHLPLYYEGGTLLLPYDAPVFRLLQASGYAPEVQQRKLLTPLRTTVSAHTHSAGKESLFSRVLRMTTYPTNE